jgi:hypothetical protein
LSKNNKKDQLWLYQGWNYSSLFKMYSIVCVLNLCVAFLLWPDVPYNFEEQLAIVNEESEMKTEVHLRSFDDI